MQRGEAFRHLLSVSHLIFIFSLSLDLHLLFVSDYGISSIFSSFFFFFLSSSSSVWALSYFSRVFFLLVLLYGLDQGAG